MSNLGLFPFMYRGDISTGGNANNLESGYYISGRFDNLENSPFPSGWGGIVVFKTNSFYTLQFASDMDTNKLRFRHKWNERWSDWKTISLT